jgi:hypothetical protein
VLDAQNPLVAQVLAGGNRQLQELAASGLLPLPIDQLVPLQVLLARGGDPDIASRARGSLRALEPRVAVPYLEREASADDLAFFAVEADDPRLLEPILRRRDTPRRVLVDLARRLPVDLQEILLLRQDAILEEPAILDALGDNPRVSIYTQRRIAEYRTHLLPQRTARLALAKLEDVPEETLDDEVVTQAVEIARVLPAEGEIEEKTGLSEGQIRLLPVPIRVRLTRNASRTMRALLVRDSNSQVAVAVLQFNSVPDSEIEGIARNRSVCEEVLEYIAKRREWMNKYGVIKAMVANPRTPVAVAMRILVRLSVRDLRELSRDRNISDAVRSNALRLYTIKQK